MLPGPGPCLPEALDFLLDGVRWGVERAGVDSRWVDGLPTALMRPLSGSGARGMMLETMEAHGADSFAGRLVSTIQGSTETTFYVLALYFGSVGIRRTRHAVACGLFADLVGYIERGEIKPLLAGSWPLDQLPAAGATVIVGGPKVAGATGGPSRVIALV